VFVSTRNGPRLASTTSSFPSPSRSANCASTVVSSSTGNHVAVASLNAPLPSFRNRRSCGARPCQPTCANHRSRSPSRSTSNGVTLRASTRSATNGRRSRVASAKWPLPSLSHSACPPSNASTRSRSRSPSRSANWASCVVAASRGSRAALLSAKPTSPGFDVLTSRRSCPAPATNRSSLPSPFTSACATAFATVSGSTPNTRSNATPPDSLATPR
jgi:hypothetical protein